MSILFHSYAKLRQIGIHKVKKKRAIGEVILPPRFSIMSFRYVSLVSTYIKITVACAKAPATEHELSMLTFFRRIRKGLLSEGVASKYILYAVGEVLLVMVGILLALQVNNWNEKRKSTKFEMQLTKEIHAAIRNDIDHVTWCVETNSASSRSCNVVLNHLKQGLDYSDTLGVHFGESLSWRKVILDYNAYETAKTYGLHLFGNDSIRHQLTDIYEFRHSWINTMEARQHDYHFNIVAPIITELFETSTVFADLKPLDIHNLRKHKEYLNVLKSSMINRKEEVRFQADLLRRLKNLDNLLQIELNDISLSY